MGEIQDMDSSINYSFNKYDKKNEPIISGLLFWVLIAMYTIAYNSSFRARSILWYGISLLVIGLLALKLTYQCKNLPLGFYAIWAVAFFSYSFLSGFWAVSSDRVFNISKTLFLIFLVNVLISFAVEKREDLERLMLINFLAIAFLLIYILSAVDLSQLGEDRLGAATLDSGWNANDIGMKFCVGCVISIYFAVKRKEVFFKVFFFCCAIIFAGVAFLTGSRKVFLVVVALIVLVPFLKSKHKLITTSIAIVSIVALYFAIMKIEPLYNVLGNRVENMLNGFFGEGTTEGSFNTRGEMIRLGWEWFLERPLFGYGLSNYCSLYEIVMGKEMYSHNNFIELLVNGGIVGFVLYYSLYVYIFTKLFNSAFRKKDWLGIVLISMAVIFFAIQVALVTYDSTLFNVVLLWCVLYIKTKGETHENS